jgi:hypothetical protein
MEEASLPAYSVAEVQAGFEAIPISVRTEVIYKDDAAAKADPKIDHT